ncbi:glycosyltransferase [Bacillus pinisoli]|uniref:glycosyltransferase n=1 Tax=Bacillus pinisoli TaxID=2901866 RepID=UPI001FF3732A|nr:glycosyltransferase [Bacillus pinisoli]
MKKKILFVNGHLNVGGVENSLINVLKSIDFNNYEVDLILFEELGDYVNEVPKNVNIIYYDFSKTYGPFKKCLLENIKNKNWFAVLLRLVFLLKRVAGVKALYLAKPLFRINKKYDCAIAYRVGLCTDFVGYVVNSKKKVTWWHHGSYDYSEDQTKRWTKLLRKFDRLIAVSDSCRDMLIDNMQEQKVQNKIITIPNMINVNEIQNKANEKTRYNIFHNDGTTLLSVGRLSPEKGMINCVHTCKKLVEAGYNVKWYLIGEGPERKEIERWIKEYRLENQFYLLGAISNPYPYIKATDIYVHPSLVESLSITVLEALALNIPVTVARSMGPAEFIRDKENGLLVEPTPEGLFKGIESLIMDNYLYNKLKKENREVLNQFSPEVIMKKIYGLIEVS